MKNFFYFIQYICKFFFIELNGFFDGINCKCNIILDVVCFLFILISVGIEWELLFVVVLMYWVKLVYVWLLNGLINYVLFFIYCWEVFFEKVQKLLYKLLFFKGKYLRSM